MDRWYWGAGGIGGFGGMWIGGVRGQVDRWCWGAAGIGGVRGQVDRWCWGGTGGEVALGCVVGCMLNSGLEAQKCSLHRYNRA